MDLGAPIGQQNTTTPKYGFDQGEHGAGTGLSGGHGVASSTNTQSGRLAESERSGFNAGLGGDHASGGIPREGHHPIADKFTGNSGNNVDPYGSTGSSGATGATGGKLDNSLDNFGGAAGQTHGHSHGHSHTHGSSGDAVSGAYEGGRTGDALTGQSHAQRTGAGVGPLGENTHSHGQSHSTSTDRSEQVSGRGAAIGGAGVAGAAGATALGSGATGHHHTGTGVGAEGGAGGHYSQGQQGQTGLTGDRSGHSGERSGHSGAMGAGAGAGALGAGAAGAASSGDNKTGKYGTTESDFDRGAPVSDPKDLDSGGPHSLVYQESTGKYVHRRELEGGATGTHGSATHGATHGRH